MKLWIEVVGIGSCFLDCNCVLVQKAAGMGGRGFTQHVLHLALSRTCSISFFALSQAVL